MSLGEIEFVVEPPGFDVMLEIPGLPAVSVETPPTDVVAEMPGLPPVEMETPDSTVVVLPKEGPAGPAGAGAPSGLMHRFDLVFENALY
jgi:hypothetical protein